jgi:AraC-like DNA-binding protein
MARALLLTRSTTMPRTAAAQADWTPTMRPESGIASVSTPNTANGTLWLHHGNSDYQRRIGSDSIELRLVVAGHATCEIDCHRHELGIGSLFWLVPSQVWRLDKGSADFEMWTAVLPPLLIEQLLGETNAAALRECVRRGDQCKVVDWRDTRCLELALSRIHQSRSEDLHRAGLAYVVVEAWETFERAPTSTVAAGVSDNVSAAVRLLAQDPTLSREALSARIGIRSTTLTRQFHAQLGVTLVTYRQRLRMQRFLELGADGRFTLLDACLRAGFGSYAQCHRAFRHSLGCSPRSYFARQCEVPKSQADAVR